MKIFIIHYLFAALFLIISCNKKEEANISPDLLVGYWSNPQICNEIVTYEKTKKLDNNTYGFAFKKNGLFVERKNTGWSAAMPADYADYNGLWLKNDSIIHVAVDYWDGTTNYQWEIIYVDNHTLKLLPQNQIPQDFEK
jgi:hypothetical protein